MFNILTFCAFTACVAWISYLATRREALASKDGYFLAGRSLGAPVIAGSLVLTNLSTEHLIGLNGQAFRHGLVVMAWETMAAAALVLLALVYLPRYLGARIPTLPQLIRSRFGARAAMVATGLYVLLYVGMQLPIVLYSGALAVSSLFELPAQLGLSPFVTVSLLIFAIGTLGAVYAVAGGLKAVAVSDTINGVGLLTFGGLVTVLALRAVAASSGGEVGMWEGFWALRAALPEHFVSMGAADSVLPASTLVTGMVTIQLFSWCCNQSFVQRALAARSLRAGQQGVLLAALIKLMGPLLIVLPGIAAFRLYGAALGDADQAYPALVRQLLPGWLHGLFAAVMVGAVLSTFNSLINSVATLLTLEVCEPLARGRFGEAELVRLARKIGVALAVVVMAVAPWVGHAPGGLYLLLQKLNALFMPPLFVVVSAALFLPRATPRAALGTLLGGPLLYGALTLLLPDWHFLHLVGVATLANFAVLFGLSRLLGVGKLPYVAVDSEPVEGGWRGARLVSAALIALTVGLHALFY